MKKIILSCLFALFCSGIYAQNDSIVVSYMVKSGTANTDTVLVYFVSADNSPIDIAAVDFSFAHNACATFQGINYSAFDAVWGTGFRNEGHFTGLSLIRGGNTYTNRYAYGNVNLFLPTYVAAPDNSQAPGVLIMKLVFTGACSDDIYMESRAENSLNVLGDAGVNVVPFSVNLLSGSNLPVEYSYFQATPQGTKRVHLEWETMTELNSDYFLLEKSTDPEFGTYNRLAKVTAAGISDQEQQYQFTDDTEMSDVMYYRLRQVDFDGASSFSKTVEVKMMGLLDFSAKLYPNPTRGVLNIDLEFSPLSNQKLKVFNLMGSLVIQENIQTDFDGKAELKFDLSDQPRGMYILQIIDEASGKMQVEKFERM